MASLLKRNDSVIDKAFARVRKNRDAVASDGMKRLLQNAMLYALGEHDHKHFGHRITRDSYGWLLLHNGKAVAMNVNEGRHGEGRATADLMLESRKAPQDGWVGILLASMEAETDRSSNIYFVVEYEQDILRATQDSIRKDFNRYFKPL